MSRREGKNRDLVSVYVDGSHEDQKQHKEVRYLLPPKTTTVDLTATSHSKYVSVDTNYDEESDFLTYQLSTIDYEENNENKYTIDPDKLPHSASAQIETDLPSPMLKYP